MKYIYVETNNIKNEISSVFNYIAKGKIDIDVYYIISGEKYTAYIIDKQRYIKKYNTNKPNDIRSVVHNYIITQNRANKINNIKNKINESHNMVIE